jgi:hypothetical protein
VQDVQIATGTKDAVKFPRDRGMVVKMWPSREADHMIYRAIFQWKLVSRRAMPGDANIGNLLPCPFEHFF